MDNCEFMELAAKALPDDLPLDALRPWADAALWEDNPRQALEAALHACPRLNWEACSLRRPEARPDPVSWFLEKGIHEGHRLISWHPLRKPRPKGAPLVSIVVPCYNASASIEKCLASLTAQSLKNIEIIIVDDGSSDKSPKLIRKLAARDKRIVPILSRKNEGTFVARKKGALAARGSYLMFCDSDDLFERDACEKASKLIARGYDIVNFSSSVCYANYVDGVFHRNMLHTLAKKEEREFAGEDVNFAIFRDRVGDTYLWNKIYLTDIVKEACASTPDEYLIIIEDVYAMVAIASLARNLYISTEKLYRYNADLGSSLIRNPKKDLERQDQVGSALHTIERYIRDNNLPLDFNFVNRIYCQVLVGNIVNSVPAQNAYAYLKKYPEILGSDNLFRFLISDFSYKQQALTKKLKKAFIPIVQNIVTVGIYIPDISIPAANSILSAMSGLIHKFGCKLAVFTETRQERILTRPELFPIISVAPSGANEASWFEHYKSFRRALEEYPVDVMFHRAHLTPALLLDILLLHMRDIPVVAHYATNFGISHCVPASAFTHHAWDEVLACADAVTCSTGMDELYLRTMGVNAWQFPDPIPEPHAELERPGPVIGMVGSFEYPSYQMESARYVFNQVLTSQKDAQLLLIGDFNDPDQKEAFLKQMAIDGSAGNITITGHLNDYTAKIRECAIFLQTRYWDDEAHPLRVALSYGIPCIVYDTPLQLIRQTGVCRVPQGDYMAAAGNIIGLLRNRKIWDDLSQKIREGCKKLSKDAWFANLQEFLVNFQRLTPLRKHSGRDYRDLIRFSAFYSGRKPA